MAHSFSNDELDRKHPSRALALLAAGLFIAVTSPAAGDEPSSEELIATRVALRTEGKDLDALAVFERAYAQGKPPRARAQIALAHQALGQCVALGGTGALLGGGVIAHALRESEVALHNDDGASFRGPGPRDTLCGGHRGAADTAEALAILGYAGSAIAAITAVVLFASSRESGERAATARAPTCGVAGLGVACGAVFW